MEGHRERVSSVVFSPDGKLLASGSMIVFDGATRIGAELKIWEMDSGRQVLSLDGLTTSVNRLAFSPDGQHLVLEGVFSPDGRRLATGSHAKVWDVHTGRESLILGASRDGVQRVAVESSDTPGVVRPSDREVNDWDARTGEPIFKLKGHTGAVGSLTFSPDNQRVATGSDDFTVRIWDAQTGQEILTLQRHTETVNAVAFSHDGKRLVSAGMDGVINIWEAAPKSGFANGEH
jgi:WD40 repeat protein